MRLAPALLRFGRSQNRRDLGKAKADGYRILTKMIPNMGYHFINPKITGFNVRKRRSSCTSTPQHPRLITLHFWVWYPNDTGIFTGTNPMVAPFNHN